MNESVSAAEMHQREEDLKKHVETVLPEMKKMCEESDGVVAMHQDAFAADYQAEEYMLLGMAIKYIGLSGKTVHIIGKNSETVA